MNNLEIYSTVASATAAIISLLISFYLIQKDRIKLDIDLSPNAEWISLLLLDDGRSIYNENGLIKTNIRIINSSNHDVSYFDLRIIDDDLNELVFYNKLQHNIFNNLQQTNVIAGALPNGATATLNIPESDFGILKSKSVTSIDIVISSESKIKSLFIMFKITNKKRLFKKIKFGYINSPYESFSGSSLVEESNKPNYKEVYDSMHN
ncbi:hypothetical protein H0A38_08400 [Lactococcus lactis]|uniref:hypothetical protein n=1 Tax=Lactococcus lactis TaxID=1358 RepID=UPI001CF33661|nr:hypothetical protein [Lactococcus lactis]UCS89695.1 hypothetical protein H0A38_08400 [Lactococcus lactis]